MPRSCGSQRLSSQELNSGTQQNSVFFGMVQITDNSRNMTKPSNQNLDFNNSDRLPEVSVINSTSNYNTFKNSLPRTKTELKPEPLKYDKWKILLLIAFCLIRLLVGFICTLTGPILVDLQRQTNSTTTQLSSIFFARGVGFLLGSILSVYTFKSHLTWIMVAFFLLIGSSCVLIPMSTNVYVLAAAYLIQTTGFNIFRTSSPALLFSITRGRDRGPALQLVTMTFIIGATLSPPIAAPFVTSSSTKYPDIVYNQTSAANTSQILDLDDSGKFLLTWDSSNKLNWLFIGMLVYTALISISTSVFGKCSGVDFSVISPTTDDEVKTKPNFKISMFAYVICSLLMTVGGAAFTTGFNFVTFHVIKTMHGTATQGAIANTIFSITVAVTSIVTIFTLKWWGYVKNLWIICFFMVLTPCLLLPTIWITESYALLCVALVSLGIATSFLFTPIFMWGAEKVSNLTVLSAWIQNGFTLAEISFPFIVGLTLDLSENAFVYWVTVLCSAFVLIFGLGEYVCRRANGLTERLTEG